MQAPSVKFRLRQELVAEHFRREGPAHFTGVLQTFRIESGRKERIERAVCRIFSFADSVGFGIRGVVEHGIVEDQLPERNRNQRQTALRQERSADRTERAEIDDVRAVFVRTLLCRHRAENLFG